MDRRDEEMIMEEVRGELMEDDPNVWFYEVNVGGKVVTGISYAGMKELARRWQGVEVVDIRVLERDDAWVAKAKAWDKQRDVALWGASMQPKRMRMRDGSERDDPFALVKAVSKAQRNALRAILPEKMLVELYEEWKRRRGERVERQVHRP